MLSSKELKKYDGKCVRVYMVDQIIIDGNCTYDDKEYNECEYGRREDSLQIVNYKLYKSTIKYVKSLEDHKGPYGKFLDPYGTLEEMAIEDGIDDIYEVLFCEDKNHIERMLRALDDYWNSEDKKVLDKKEVISLLWDLYDTNIEEDLKGEIKGYINKWEKQQ